jgi:SAM-dependent methyltransferase
MAGKSAPESSDTGYALGYSKEEFERLEWQGAFIGHTTSELLHRAGLTAGMRVLDLGCGVGDVSLLAADVVGPSGAVVGVDRSAESTAVAERRAALAGKTPWVQFITDDFDTFDSDVTFDAVIGRLVLMYQPDPAATLRRVLRLVRPGGLVAFQEISVPTVRSIPDGPVHRSFRRMVTAAFESTGADTDMGTKLPRVFVDSGLSAPEMTVAGIAESGGVGQLPHYYAGVLRSLAPMAVRNGVFTYEEAGLDTLADRLSTESIELRSCLLSPLFIGAWSRKS